MSERLRLGRAFGKGRSALVAYLMAGYPDREGCLSALAAVARAGADLIELGVPYTDQLADGTVIVNASSAARVAAGGAFGLVETLDLLTEFRGSFGESAPPVAIMCYLNPLMMMGFSAAADAIANAGADGVVVPDMPPDVATPWLRAADGLLDTVFLAAPTSTPERLAKVAGASSGFVYCVSTAGITGERSQLPPELAQTVARVKAHTDLPVAVGFGISTPEQAGAVAAFADGVVVGSALVRRQADPPGLEAYCASLARAVHAAG
jgi:tryptophan synthase alpha chain